jgi:uncharacterized protein YqhQ
MVELFVPMAVFVMIAVVAGLVTRLIATASLHKTIREALRSDPGSVPVLAERLDRHPPWGDALLGWIFLALAVAMLLLGLTEEDPDQRRDILRSIIVPVVVGVAVLVYARLAARRAS